MGLRIANNIAAMNAHRWLSGASDSLGVSLERLSSGYRINKAADDAAGLAISQSFRADIASYAVAKRNTSEAAALLQVAEGGMDQIGNMLTRLKELATQAASANVGTSERAKIDSEGDELLAEINRIANGTKYGSDNLINGQFGDRSVATFVGREADSDGTVDFASKGTTYYKYDFDAVASAGAYTITLADDPTIVATGSWTIDNDGTASGYTATNGDVVVSSSTNTANTIAFSELGITLADTGAMDTGDFGATDIFTVADTGLSTTGVSASASVTTGTWTLTDTAGSATLVNGTESQTVSLSASQVANFDQLGIKVTLGSGYGAGELNSLTFSVSSSGNKTFQVGAENDANNQITVSTGDARTTNLGTTAGSNALSTIDLSTTSGAQTALSTIDDAVSDLTGLRADVGTYMNRLAYSSANLATIIENVQAAESVIRDVDMASEMTDFTKNQIMMQAGTAMLAQANMIPQQVLALFG